MHWRRQGDIGEASALEWLVGQGWRVYLPWGHSENCDLVADMDGRLAGVQVKTTTCRQGSRWKVTLATRGGNQSWSGLVKRFSPDRCDWLFVHAGDGRRWFMPSTAVEGGSAIVLGGPKYEEFEVDAGRPLPGALAEV
ncbi:MAG TPA: group I intron-associated PD-(D/E)XK endonuclease [Capillimicrobium sp.]